MGAGGVEETARIFVRRRRARPLQPGGGESKINGLIAGQTVDFAREGVGFSAGMSPTRKIYDLELGV